MSLYNELTQLGVFDPDAQLLDQVYGTEPDFMTGLEQMAEVYFTDKKPRQMSLTGEPWITIHQSLMSVNGKSIKKTFENAIELLDPTVKLPLWDALSKAWHRISTTKRQGGRRRRVKTVQYIHALKNLGYDFRMNTCNDDVEVNQEPITDAVRAELRCKMRDKGFELVHEMEDAYTAHAHKHRYHPIQEYLDTLSYDGGQHIAELASHFKDRDGVFGAWLRRWLIGAVAKAYEAEQNYMLALDGPQGIGKSHFAMWLGSPLPEYFIEGPISPDNKDCHIRLVSKWVWEVAELGATTRKADREALKFFISQRTVTIRRPYARYDLRKPALSSFIGTINNEIGFLADKTGNRRFLACTLEDIDWKYTDVDVDQVWAEAQALYLAGEPWQLTPKEAARARELNKVYEIDDPIEGLLKKYFEVDSAMPSWTPSAEILQVLELNGLRGNTRANSMALAAVLTSLGMEKRKRRNAQGQLVWGYQGIRVI